MNDRDPLLWAPDIDGRHAIEQIDLRVGPRSTPAVQPSGPIRKVIGDPSNERRVRVSLDIQPPEHDRDDVDT